jgi:hypothetical protein
VWRHLVRAAQSEAVVLALQHEVDRYLERLDSLACARDLPRVGVDLRRLVVIPRMFVNGEAYRAIDAVLQQQPGFASLEGLASLRGWFVTTVIESMQTAVGRARPSARRPLAAGASWITVGVNEQYEWWVPITGPSWPGHYYLLELRRMPITTAVRKATMEAVASLERSLPSLSRIRRYEIVRQAALSVRGIAA